MSLPEVPVPVQIFALKGYGLSSNKFSHENKS